MSKKLGAQPLPQADGTVAVTVTRIKKAYVKSASAKALPTSVRAYAKKVAADPKKSEDFLKRAGIIIKAGELNPNYR